MIWTLSKGPEKFGNDDACHLELGCVDDPLETRIMGIPVAEKSLVINGFDTVTDVSAFSALTPFTGCREGHPTCKQSNPTGFHFGCELSYSQE